MKSDQFLVLCLIAGFGGWYYQYSSVESSNGNDCHNYVTYYEDPATKQCFAVFTSNDGVTDAKKIFKVSCDSLNHETGTTVSGYVWEDP